MFVAMPTAIPEPPLISRFGNRAGSTTGSWRPPFQVGGDERRVVAAERPAVERHGGKGDLELALLGSEEPDVLCEQPRVAAVRDHDFDLAVLVMAQAADHPELEEEQLDIARQLLAVG